jgi:hypothetical protein
LKSIINKISFFLICFTAIGNMLAQNDNNKLIIANDSISPNFIDSLRIDSAIIKNDKPIKISKDAITNLINYGAIDSNFTDIANKEIHLYGFAYVNYETVKMKADYIIVNFGNNTVKAFAQRDSTYKAKEKPSFDNGDTNASFEEIAYNFKTKKAFIKNIYTQESEFYIQGERSKYVAKNDSLSIEDRVFQEDAIITPCNHIPPHFGIRTRKMKMIPKKIAVMGPAQLQIAGIPTPAILPFGFFPLIKGRSAGLIFPNNYTTDANLGFGLQGIGYYFPINDNVDAIVRGDIWTRGTYRLQGTSKYSKRYKYTGNIDLNFSNQVSEDPNGKPTSQKSFGINISHNQDSKAHPYRNIGGSINITTNRNSQRTSYEYQERLNNKLYSNFNYTYKWPESPFSFRAALNHNQDNSTRVVNITLPDASLNMNTIQPFKRKNTTGDPIWYENVSVGYRAGFKSFVKTTDTTLFTQATLKNIETGFNHGATVSTSARALKYFSISPSITYDETYFLKTLTKNLDTLYRVDTIKSRNAEGNLVVERTNLIKSPKITDQLINDFNVLRKFNAGVNVNTALFATKKFSKGWLRGLRHTMKPSVSFNYSPETELKFRKFVNTSVDTINYSYYNPFQTGAFPQSLNQEQMTLGYNISNIFEAKYRNKKDSVDKKFNIFNSFYVLGNYNFAADSFNWSDLSISGNADLIQGLSSIQFGAVFTPYEIDYAKSRKRNELLIKNNENKKLIQLLTFNVGLNTNLSFTQLKEFFNGKKDSNAEKKKVNDPHVSFSTLFDRMRLNHNFTIATIKTPAGKDSLTIGTHSIFISGDIPLSKNWSFSIGSISYDLKAKQLVYPSFGFGRDLHCWTMRFNWYPDNGVYNFFIGVKSGALNFLKYDYRQDRIPRI